jgi:hypothetical protein
MTENALPGVGDWAPCYCCRRSYLAANMVSLCHRSGDVLCVSCVAWLYDRSRPIVRKLHPIWEWPARIRLRRTPAPVTTNNHRGPPEPTALCFPSRAAHSEWGDGR